MPKGKPNILVIWGDDIGYWNISAYSKGMMGYQTPNIEGFAWEAWTERVPDPMPLPNHDNYVYDLVTRLAIVRSVVGRAHRRRRRGQHSRPDVLAAVTPLVDLWRGQRKGVRMKRLVIDAMALVDHRRTPMQIENAIKTLPKRVIRP